MAIAPGTSMAAAQANALAAVLTRSPRVAQGRRSQVSEFLQDREHSGGIIQLGGSEPRPPTFACAPVFSRRLPAGARFSSAPLHPLPHPKRPGLVEGAPATCRRVGRRGTPLLHSPPRRAVSRDGGSLPDPRPVDAAHKRRHQAHHARTRKAGDPVPANLVVSRLSACFLVEAVQL